MNTKQKQMNKADEPSVPKHGEPEGFPKCLLVVVSLLHPLKPHQSFQRDLKMEKGE